MKNIGILTLYPSYNYGGILQCIALYLTLKEHGFNPILIHRPQYIKGSIKKLTINILSLIPKQNIKGIRQHYLDTQIHKEFINHYIYNQTKKVNDQKTLSKVCKQYDLEAVVVGSDQVWRIDYIDDGHYQNYFLDFVPEHTKKIAFSASFGKEEWSDSPYTDSVRKLLKEFSSISTREDSGVKICQNTFKIDGVKHTLDPTMLIDVNTYKSMIKLDSSQVVQEKNLVTYILDTNSDKSKVIASIEKSLSVKTQHLYGFKQSKQTITIPQWLNALNNAEFIITDSFHGMIFSILFNKNFIVLANPQRGLARFESVLSMFGLEDRLISSLNQHIDITSLKPIDYKYVNQIIEEKRKMSLDFLIQAVN